MNKPKYTRRINLLSLILLLIFASTLSYCYFMITNSATTSAGNYLNTIKGINEFQTEYKNFSQNNTNSNNFNPVYSDGLTALLSAYEEYSNLKDVSVTISGSIIANADVTVYKFEIQGSVKKVNGVVYSETISYCKESPAQSSGSKIVFKDGAMVETKTKSVNKVNGKLVADYSGGKIRNYQQDEYKEERGTYPGELFYVVNKNTVTNTSNFYVKKNIDGSIKGYNTDFVLSPTLGTIKYSKMLAGIITDSKDYKFSNCKGSLNLDENGKLLSMHTNEIYTFDYKLIGNVFWNVNCTSSMNFYVNI